MFPLIFVCQNSARDFGQTNAGQLWPCQKQPLTKITTCQLAKTRSGFPAKSRL